jgi:hypothetical protein
MRLTSLPIALYVCIMGIIPIASAKDIVLSGDTIEVPDESPGFTFNNGRFEVKEYGVAFTCLPGFALRDPKLVEPAYMISDNQIALFLDKDGGHGSIVKKGHPDSMKYLQNGSTLSIGFTETETTEDLIENHVVDMKIKYWHKTRMCNLPLYWSFADLDSFCSGSVILCSTKFILEIKIQGKFGEPLVAEAMARLRCNED